MSTITLDQAVAKLRDLPTLPLVVTELISTFERADVSVGELAAKVSNDQALTAKTLRLANSSFYGLQCKVRTIEQAIAVLGLDSVRALVTSAGIIDNFSGGAGAFDHAGFWRHAVATALCAKSLARLAKCNQELAFVSGLLHDIGRLALITRFPAQYEAAIAHRSEADCDMLQAERAVLGIDHAVVGRALAEHWKFPLLIQRAIAHHHAPMAQDLGAIPCVVHAADAIVHGLDLVGHADERVPAIAQDAWNSLGIDAAGLRRVFEDTESEFENACQILTASH
jgi:putative nucleotidyltransferase with HDIG domain